MEKVLVIGLGKSGIGSVKLLSSKVYVAAYDAKKEDEISEETKSLLASLNVKAYFSEDPEENFDTVVVSPSVPMDNPLVLRYKEKGAEIISELELSYRFCKGSFLAITGTNGKTTTTTLLGEICKNSGMDTAVVGNIGNAVTENCEAAEKDTLMVTEVSSFQLEAIKEFKPHISAILNLTPDHLDRHKSPEAYYACKGRITENQTMEDYFVYNFSDPETKKFADGVNNVNKVPFSAEDGGALALLDNSCYISDGKFTVKKNGEEHIIGNTGILSVPGKHNLENALAAIAMAVFAGIDDKTISKSIRGFKGVEHRLEMVRELKGVKYINDSKGTNPDASIKALEAIPSPIILIAGGYDKKLSFEPFIKAFNGKVSYLILLGQTADIIANTALSMGFPDDRIIKCNTLSACVASAAKLAEAGDNVLLSPACASWGMFENYEQRGAEFKKLVKNL